MKTKIPCEIIKDLLPSYIDNLTSEASNSIVKEHLLTCENCRNTVKCMGKAEEIITEDDEKEIDFLKKSKMRNRKIITVVIVLALLGYVYITLCGHTITGTPTPYEYMNNVKVSVEDDKVVISGYLEEFCGDINDVSFSEENGIVHVQINSGGFVLHGQNGFDEEFIASQDVKEVWISQRVVWCQGNYIDRETAEIYSRKHPYVGDASRTQHTIIRTGLASFLGEYTLKIQSQKMPYGITLVTDRQFSGDIQKDIEMRMKQYATILIGAIDNLSYVTYEYYIGGEIVTLTFDVEAVNEFAGNSVKEQFGAPYKLQEMLIKIGFIKPII